MTSKNLFLASILENAKRRIWLLVVSVLIFVVALPTFTAMQLSVISQRAMTVEAETIQKSMYELAGSLYSGSDGGLLTIISLFAIASGLQGFSYLYDRSKIDFYHSKPVESKSRFFTIWLNGILAWMIPYLVGTFINLVIFAANGILDVALLGKAGLFFAIAFCLYLSMYHLAILALMLTGKLIVTCMGILVFLLYEVGVRTVLVAFCSWFYQFYCQDITNSGLTPLLSPVTYLNYYAQGKWSSAFTMFILLCFAGALLALSYVCYKRRPAEKAGSAMVFGVTQPIIRVGITVPVALAAGIITCSAVEYSPLEKRGNPGFPIFIGMLVLLIVSCLIQVIYEADIKAIFHKKIQILLSAGIALVIALIFRYDLTGYDTRLPAEDKMDYAILITPTNDRYGNRFMDENMKLKSKDQYVFEKMRLHDETAKAVRDLAEHSIKLQKALREGNQDGDYEYYYAEFYFYQKNGKVIARQIPVAVREKESASYLKQIENSEDFIRANEPAMSEELKKVLDGNEWKVDASWGNSLYSQKLTRKQARELLELYRMDLLAHNYEARSNELAIGEFSLYVDMKVSYSRQLNFQIFPSYTNCIRYLEENGFLTKQYLDPVDVEKIVITQYIDTEDGDMTYEDVYVGDVYDYAYPDTYGYVSSYQEMAVPITTVTVSYKEKEEIEKIINATYLGEMEWDGWYCESPGDGSCRIEVFFKEDSIPYTDYGYSTNICFLNGQEPAFVKQDLKNAPVETK